MVPKSHLSITQESLANAIWDAFQNNKMKCPQEENYEYYPLTLKFSQAI